MQLPRVRSGRVASLVSVLVAGQLALGGCYSDKVATGPAPATPAVKASYAGYAADALAFLPADSEIVFGIDLQQFLRSPLWGQLEARLQATIGNSLSQFKAKCGYDPLATLRDLTVGLKGGGGGEGGGKPEGVVVVRGVDRDKTFACLPQVYPGRGAKLEGGYVTIPGTDGEPPGVMTFVDASTSVVLIGPTASRATLEAALAAGAPLRKSRAFSELFGQIDSKQTLWLVLNGNAKMFDALAQLGSRPRAVLGSLSLANGLAASGRIRFESPEQASQLATMAQGALGGIKAMFDELAVDAEGADLTLRASMSPQQLESMISLVGGLIPTPGP